MNACNKYGTDKEDRDTTSSTSLKKILPSLYAENKGKITAVPTSAQVSWTIEHTSKSMHKEYLTPPEVAPKLMTPNPINLTLTPHLIEQMNAKLAHLVSNDMMTDSTKFLQNKRKFETRLNTMFQKLILIASKRSGDNEVTDPTPSSLTFFKQKNLSEAKAYLYHKMNLKLNMIIYIPAGMTTAIHTFLFYFWERQDTPSNFSFFLVPPQSSNMISDTADAIALSIKTSDSCGGIDTDNIHRLTKIYIFIPTNTNELEYHINHCLYILNMILGSQVLLWLKSPDGQST